MKLAKIPFYRIPILSGEFCTQVQQSSGFARKYIDVIPDTAEEINQTEEIYQREENRSREKESISIFYSISIRGIRIENPSVSLRTPQQRNCKNIKISYDSLNLKVLMGSVSTQ